MVIPLIIVCGCVVGIAAAIITIVVVRKRKREADRIQEQEERIRLLNDRARGKLMNYGQKQGIALPPKQLDLLPINDDPSENP